MRKDYRGSKKDVFTAAESRILYDLIVDTNTALLTDLNATREGCQQLSDEIKALKQQAGLPPGALPHFPPLPMPNAAQYLAKAKQVSKDEHRGGPPPQVEHH
jgi:hypothetical protein